MTCTCGQTATSRVTTTTGRGRGTDQTREACDGCSPRDIPQRGDVVVRVDPITKGR